MRIEHDALGDLEVPEEAYYGVQTVRCTRNYPVSSHTYNEYPEVIRAIAEIKIACALTNVEIGMLSKEKGDAIVKAATEVAQGKLAGHFPVNIWRSQGTGVNMNVNEVIANRANEILTGSRGYDPVHPNTHVNMCQSSNDVFPTAEHIVLRRSIVPLLDSLEDLEKALGEKAEEFRHSVRLGRTGFQDALPMTWGQVFGGWQSSVHRVRLLLASFRDTFSEGVLGGTAIGTGMGQLPGYAERIYENLSKVVGFPMHLAEMKDEVIPDSGLFDAMRNTDHHFILMGYVKATAAAAGRIAQDLLLFSSGPRSGIGEVSFGDGEDKAFQSCEAMIDVLGEVLATEKMAYFSSAEGELDHSSQNSAAFISILDALSETAETLRSFTKNAVTKALVNEEVCRRNAELTTSISAMVSSLFGYLVGTAVAKHAIKDGISCKEAALKENLLPPEICEDLFDVEKLTDRRAMVGLFRKYGTLRKIS